MENDECRSGDRRRDAERGENAECCMLKEANWGSSLTVLISR